MTKDPARELAKTIVELEKTAGIYKDRGARKGPLLKEPTRRKKVRAAQKAARKRNR